MLSRFFPLVCFIASLLAACGSGSGSSGPYSGGSRSLTPTRTAGNQKGGVTLSGAVNGDMNLDNVICGPRGATIVISLVGKVAETQYGIQINTVDTGGFLFGTPTPADQAALVLLSDQTVTKGAVPRWSAGFAGTPGKGTLAIGRDHSGTIDAELEGSEGTKGTVHVKGLWKCSTGGAPSLTPPPTTDIH